MAPSSSPCSLLSAPCCCRLLSTLLQPSPALGTCCTDPELGTPSPPSPAWAVPVPLFLSSAAARAQRVSSGAKAGPCAASLIGLRAAGAQQTGLKLRMGGQQQQLWGAHLGQSPLVPRHTQAGLLPPQGAGGGRGRSQHSSCGPAYTDGPAFTCAHACARTRCPWPGSTSSELPSSQEGPSLAGQASPRVCACPLPGQRPLRCCKISL